MYSNPKNIWQDRVAVASPPHHEEGGSMQIVLRPCLLYSASSCYDNRPLWACLLSTWQCPMVGLLRATRVIWRASQSPHLEYWDLFICLFIYLFLMRSPEIISSDQIPALDSGTSGKLQLGPELGSTRPSHQPSMKHSSADSRMGSAHYKEPSWGLSRKGRPCGESRRTTIWKQPF